MSDIFNVVKEKQNWSGTRSELRDLISAIESDIPEQMLKTKKTYELQKKKFIVMIS